MEESLNASEDEQPVVEKKDYTPPTLTIYGKLTELTAGGTGVAQEGQDTKNKNKFP